MKKILKTIFKNSLLFLFLCASLSCVHINTKIEKLPIRATKSKILKTLGDPYKIDRKLGRDYWTYKFIIEGKHYTRDIIIKDGILYRKSKLKPFSLKNF